MEQEVAAHLEAQKDKGGRSQRTSGHATTNGQDYEVALLCLVFLRAVRLASDFFLLSNHALAGKFDDVVLFYKLQGDCKYRAIFVQAKHKENPAEKRLTASNPFQLKKHSGSFAEISNLCVQPIKVQNQEIEVMDVSIVFYSNTGCDYAGIARDDTVHPDVKNLRDFLNTGGRLLRVSDAQRLGLPREFVNHLTLCIEQMSVNEADQYLERELDDLLGLTSSAVARHLRKKLRKGVKRWWNDRGPTRCLTAESEEWKELLEEQVARLNGVSQLNLGFTQDALAVVRSVVNHRQSWITVADKHQAMATRVRLLQALGSSCLVLEANFLKKERREEVSALWGTMACPSLVVDLSASSPDELLELLDRLQTDVDRHSGRRLGVIAQEEPPEGRWLLYEAEATWSVLHSAIRDGLLSIKIDLQGHALSLRDVVGGEEDDAPDFMTDKVISAFCDSATAVTQLGVALEDSSSLDNYVHQCLQRTDHGEINYDALQKEKTLVFSHNSFPLKIVNNYGYSVLTLSSLHRTNHIARTTFVFGVIPDSRIRKECCRLSVRGVSEDVGLERKLTEFVPFPWLCQDKVIIVEGIPGVGKSTFVTAMCSKVKERFPYCWVLRFDLAKHTGFMKGKDFSDTSDLTTFLLSGIPREQRDLQRDFLEHSLHVRGNVFLFLDAFDEISPTYTAQCCRLLKGIASEVKFQRMVVTTRSVTSKELEQALGTKAFNLPVFSEEEQNLYLERFCENQGLIVDENKISFLRQAAGPVLETPLICRMAAHVLLYTEDQNLLRYKHPWIRVVLYKRFVEQTTFNRLAEKLQHPLSVLEETLLESQSKEHLRNLEALAVRKLLPEDQLSNFELSTILPEEKLGLVVSDGDSVDFHHRTFAEFFLGCWLARHWHKCDQKLLRELLSQENWEFISATLSWSLFKDFPLHVAVARGEEVQQMYPGTTDTGGRSPLHVAAMTRGSRLLVTIDDDLHHKQDKLLGITPVSCAEMFRNWEFLETLIGKGKTLEGLKFFTDRIVAQKVLPEFVEQDLEGLFKLILRLHEGIFDNWFSRDKDTLLHLAAANNSTKVLIHLIREFNDVNVVNFCGSTPIHYSAALGHVEAMRLFLDNGADPNSRNENGNTVLLLAAFQNRLEVVKLLSEKGVDFNVQDEHGDTALILAADQVNVEVVKALLEKGVNVNMQNQFGHTALMMAALQGSLELVKMLLEKGADTNIKDKTGCTALMMAADQGLVQIVKILLEKGVDANVKDEDGCTALMMAADQGQPEIVKMLLDKGVDPNVRDGDGCTALMMAVGQGHVEIVKLLLQKGVNPKVKDKDGNTSLILASSRGNLMIVKLLLQNGVDPNIDNKAGNTAVIAAAYRGHIEVVKTLLDKVVNLNVQNKFGYTALIAAAVQGHTEVVKVLLEKGAHPNAMDKRGNTALVLATLEGHQAVMKEIQKSERIMDK